MIGRLKDLIFTRSGEQIVSFTTKTDFSGTFDDLADVDVDIEIKKHYDPRSGKANRYMWELCGKIAEKLSTEDAKITKDDVYRKAVRDVGIYRDFHLPESESKSLRAVWEHLGTGWITELVDYDPNGEDVIVRCYYGSSRYNAKQMSRLIDYVVDDAKALDIEVKSPDEIANMKSLWATAPIKKGF